MRALFRCAAAVILVCGAAAAAADTRKPDFDFSAIEQVWRIAAVLERDEEPAEASWAALFQSAGYRELMRREPYFDEDGFKNDFRLAFNPSQAAARSEALAKRPNSTAAHFARIAGRRDILRRLQAGMERGTVMAEALAKARALLPAGALDGAPYPPIAFIFFAPDGRGYDPIIIDWLYAADQGDGLVDFLAHEAHHYYRNRIRAYDEGDVRVADQDLLNGLTQLQIEGIADQIDKHEPYFRKGAPESSAYAAQYRKNHLDSPRILAEVNRRLEQAAAAPGETPGLMDLLPQSGHPTGYFMARAIIDQGGAEAMVATVGNPFAFLYLYNRAALKSGAYPAFSRKTLEYLRKLETAYCRKPETALFREAVLDGFDPTAVTAFWAIADRLEQGIEPTAVEWSRLVDHPAYAELAGHEGRAYAPETIRDRMDLVFNPSRAGELEAKLEQDAEGMTAHFASLKTKRTRVEGYVHDLGADDWVQRVMADVRPFLPAGTDTQEADPLFVPLIFSFDLRYGYQIFIFDPSYGAEQPASIEYHARSFALNYYRDLQLVVHPGRLKAKHAEAVALLATLEQHGFMENIRPKNAVFAGNPARQEADTKAFEAGLEEAPAAIGQLDRMLAEIGKSPAETGSWSVLSSMSLPLEGRPVGFFMARTIIDQLGKEQLAAVLGDPFGFVRLYNEAANRTAGALPCFSEAAVRLISGLEKEYRRGA